jgi:bifunctional non-homologous end joining protein LigD
MNPRLSAYLAKRNFDRTSEPQDEPVLPADKARFVIQRHRASRLHYDLRLEIDGVFRSWALARGPSLDPADKRLAVETEDHPLAYGDFEGTIPAGEYGGGTMMIWDRGLWAPHPGTTVEGGLASGDFKVVFVGERMNGSWVLVRIKKNRPGDNNANWLFIKHRDGFEKPGDQDALLKETTTSVASGRTLEEIAAGKPPQPKPFMLG